MRRSAVAKFLVIFICIAFIAADIIVLSTPEYRIFAAVTIPATILLIAWVGTFWKAGVFDIDDDDSFRR